MKTIKNLIGIWKLYKQLQKISNAGYYKAYIKIYANTIWIGTVTKTMDFLDKEIDLDL